MSSIKPKIGKCPDCDNGKDVPLIGGKCQTHYWGSRAKKSEKKKSVSTEPKPRAKIRHRSLKREKEERLYREKTRPEFLTQHEECEAKIAGCTFHATEVHHKEGREGHLLNKVGSFLAVCRNCHNHIEMNGEEAREKGWSISRIGKKHG